MTGNITGSATTVCRPAIVTSKHRISLFIAYKLIVLFFRKIQQGVEVCADETGELLVPIMVSQVGEI